MSHPCLLLSSVYHSKLVRPSLSEEGGRERRPHLPPTQTAADTFASFPGAQDLEPAISEAIMTLHHTKHHAVSSTSHPRASHAAKLTNRDPALQTYVANLNKVRPLSHSP